MAYVYRHIRLDKNQPFYIGIADDSKNGLYTRAHGLHGRNPLHQSIVDKTEVEVEIVLDDLTWEDACEKEKELISLYGRIMLNNGCLSNLTAGGEGTLGRIDSLEINAKRSDALKGRVFSEETLAKMKASRNKRTDSQKGYKRSEETKEKNRQSHLGKTASIETKLKQSESAKGRIPWNKGLTYKLKNIDSNEKI
jgi:hypothetical protein